MEKNKTEITLYDLYLSIKRIISFLLSRWVKILIVAFLLGIVGITYAFLSKTSYRANITFAMEEESGSSGKLSSYTGIASQFGVDLGGGSSNLFASENLIEFFRSETIINQTLFNVVNINGKDDLLINYYIQKSAKKSDDKNKILPFKKDYIIGNDRKSDSIIKKINKNIGLALKTGKIDKKLNILFVSFQDNDEIFAKQFIETISATVINYYINYKVEKAAKNVEILSHQVDSVRGLITGDVVSIASSNDLNVNPLRQMQRVGNQQKQMNVQTNTLVYGELLKQLELARITLRRETPLIKIIDKPILPLEKIKKSKILMGILFAFVGGILTCLYLLFKKFIAENKQKTNS